MSVINAIDYFQKKFNEAPSHSKDLVKTTREVALLPDQIITAEKMQEKRKEKQEKEFKFDRQDAENERIFVGRNRSTIEQEKTDDEQEIGG